MVREFDLKGKAFIPDGFYLPEAKRTCLGGIGTFSSGLISAGSLTSSDIHGLSKNGSEERRFQRPRRFSKGSDDVSVDASVVHDHGRTYEFIRRGVTFFTSQTYVQRRRVVKIEAGRRSSRHVWRPNRFVALRLMVNGKSIPGSLLAGGFDAYLKGERRLAAHLNRPSGNLAGTSETKLPDSERT